MEQRDTDPAVAGMRMAYERQIEMLKQSQKEMTIGMWAGVFFAAMWVVALNWSGEFTLLKYAGKTLGTWILISIPVALGVASATVEKLDNSVWKYVFFGFILNAALVFYVCFR